MPITNPKLINYDFLKVLKEDDLYTDRMIQKGIQILQNLCIKIETEKPSTKKEVGALIETASQQFNDLQSELYEDDNQVSTLARNIISANFNVILDAYGYDFDMEDIFPESGSIPYQSPLL